MNLRQQRWDMINIPPICLTNLLPTIDEEYFRDTGTHNKYCNNKRKDFGKPVTEDFRGKWRYTILTDCPSYYINSCYFYENEYYLPLKCSTEFIVMNPPVATINNDVTDFYSTRRSGISRPLTLDLYYAYKYRPGKQIITFKYNNGKKGKFIVEGPNGKRGETESKDILAMYIGNDKVEFEPENDESVIQYVHRYKKNDAPIITCQSLSHLRGKILIDNTLLRAVSSWVPGSVPGIEVVGFDSGLSPSDHEKHLDCIYKDENNDYTVTARIIFHFDDDTPKPDKIQNDKSVVKIWINGEIKTSNYKLLYQMNEVVNITCAYKYKENPKRFYSELNLYFFEKDSNNRPSEILKYASEKRGDEYYLRSLNTLNENYDGKTIYCGFSNQRNRLGMMAKSVEVTMEMIETSEAQSTTEGNSVLESTTEGNSVNAPSELWALLALVPLAAIAAVVGAVVCWRVRRPAPPPPQPALPPRATPDMTPYYSVARERLTPYGRRFQLALLRGR